MMMRCESWFGRLSCGCYCICGLWETISFPWIMVVYLCWMLNLKDLCWMLDCDRLFVLDLWCIIFVCEGYWMWLCFDHVLVQIRSIVCGLVHTGFVIVCGSYRFSRKRKIKKIYFFKNTVTIKKNFCNIGGPVIVTVCNLFFFFVKKKYSDGL